MFYPGTILQVAGFSKLLRVDTGRFDTDYELRCIYVSEPPHVTYVGLHDKVVAMYPSLEYVEQHHPELLI